MFGTQNYYMWSKFIITDITDSNWVKVTSKVKVYTGDQHLPK